MPKQVTTPAARLPAKELMVARKRVTFGQAFIHGVLAGYHRDFAKIRLLGKELGVGSHSELKKLADETVRERVAAAILATEEGKLPTSAPYAA